MVGRCIPYLNSPFLGDMLIFGGVNFQCQSLRRHVFWNTHRNAFFLKLYIVSPFCVFWKQKLQISRANSLIYALLDINKSGKHQTFDKSGWMPMRPSDVCCLHLRRRTQWQCHSACLRVKVNQHFSAWELILNYKNCHQVIKKASLFQKDVALNWRKIKQSTGIFSPVIFAPTFLTIQVNV